MEYSDLRHFLRALESGGELLRIRDPVSARLEMTAVGDFALRRAGPALIFESPVGYKIPVLANLFGTTRRVALAMGATEASELRDIGLLLADLKEPEPPKRLRDAGRLLQMARTLWTMQPAIASRAPCREVIVDGADVDLARCRSRPAGPRTPVP